jgi:phosphoenolpyruvate---glycerone phosphotransferase subunit DhaL
MVTKDEIVSWLRKAEREIGDSRVVLTDLDSAGGDGDHGNNLYRGFRKLVDELPQYESKDIGGILKGAGMALRTSVGGAAGQLYGAFFLRSADAATGKIELSTRDVGEMLRAGLDGVLMKGRKKQGERTMVDALLPAVEGFEHAAQTGKGTVAALREAVVRAEWGMKSTAGDDDSPTGFMQSRNRRSEDAGAMSSYLLLRALLDAVD